MLDQVFQVVGEYNDLEATEGSRSEFLGSDAGKADFFPDLGDIGLLGSFESSLVLLELN